MVKERQNIPKCVLFGFLAFFNGVLPGLEAVMVVTPFEVIKTGLLVIDVAFRNWLMGFRTSVYSGFSEYYIVL